MDNCTKIDQLLKIIYDEEIYNEKGTRGTHEKLSFYSDFLFSGIDLTGKKILDIGSGHGFFFLYVT